MSIEAVRTRTWALPLLLGLGAWAAAAGVRYGLMESAAAGLACGAAAPPAWCTVRPVVGLLIYHQAFGWSALGASLLAWRLRSPSLTLFALWAALTGLVLYNATLASFAFVLAVLRTARVSHYPSH
jgi:hypothetical protein